MPDCQKTREEFIQDWEECTKCTLGDRRNELNGVYISGDGCPRGVMIIGEAPTKADETYGTPFSDDSGLLLKKVLTKVGLSKFYLTNLVGCRSCSPVLGPDGSIRLFGRKRGPPTAFYRDEQPLPVHVETCKERLLEEIYRVDPILVIGLGALVCATLTGKPVSMNKDRGTILPFSIPGAGHRAVLTEKKKAWVRIKNGQFHLPMVQSSVDYSLLVAQHPAYVLRKLQDQHEANSPLAQFVNDLKLAVSIYDRYMLEVHGTEPSFAPAPMSTSELAELVQMEAKDSEED